VKLEFASFLGFRGFSPPCLHNIVAHIPYVSPIAPICSPTHVL